MPRSGTAKAFPLGTFAILLSLMACDGGGTTGGGELGSISGLVTAEGEALEGVSVSTSGPEAKSTTTDPSGSYAFEDLVPGTYEVGISGWPADVTFPDPDQNVAVGAGASVTADFSGTILRTAAIDGIFRVDGDPEAGAAVSLSGPEERQTTTGSDGRYRFGGLRAGSYVVTLEAPGDDIEVDDAQKSVELGVGEQAVRDFDGDRIAPATVRVPYVETPGSSLRLNPAAVHDEVDVVVEVEPGSETVTAVRLFLGDVQVASRTFAVGDLTGSTKLEMRVNTAEFDPDTGDPLFLNGSWTAEAVVDTEESGARVATATLELGLANVNRIGGFAPVSVGTGVVSEGRRWFGARDLTFHVLPVIYDPDRAIGAVTVRATGSPSGNGGPSMDLGSGFGADHRVEGPEPFAFTASVADNGGVVEDDPAGPGHRIRVVRVYDEDGADITSEFFPGRTEDLEGFYVDFVAPRVGAGSQVRVGGIAPAGEWFSEGQFTVTALSETGSGGTTTAFEVDDADLAGPLAGVDAIADLPEGGNGRYTLSAVSIADAVGNAVDPGDLPPASAAFGVDRTPVAITEALPVSSTVLNTDDAAGDGIDDNRLAFTAQDPLLADGSSGSGYGRTSGRAIDPAGGVFTPGGVDPDLSGQNTISLSGLLEGTWTVEATTTDLATPTNETSFTYSVIVDRTGPTATFTDLPPSSVTVSAGTLTFTLEGTVADENGVSEVVLTVRDADGGTADVCELSDPLVAVGSGPGNVSRNEVDVTSEVLSSQDAPSDEGDFTASFQFHNAGAEQDVCFFVESADVATDRDGDPEPNVSFPSSRTVIDWS